MVKVEDLREKFAQTALETQVVDRPNSEQAKIKLFERGYIQKLVMDGRTPIKTLGAKQGSKSWGFYVIPPEGYDAYHEDFDLIEKILPSGEQGGRTFLFKDGHMETVSAVILTSFEEGLLQARVRSGEKRRSASIRKLSRLYDEVHPH